VCLGAAGLAAFVIASASACRGRERAVPDNAPRRPAVAAPPAASANAKRYPLRGVITAADAKKSEITVSHEEIPGFMNAMTMAFPVRDDPSVVAILRPGDRIEATLVVDGPKFWLEQVLTKGFVPTPAAPGGAPGGVTPASLPGTDPNLPAPNKGIAVGEPAPDFTLTDQTGRSVRLSDFRGEPVAVTFVYTRCPVATACPMTVSKFAKMNAALASEKFGQLLAVTIDPQNDTVSVLRDFAQRVGADPKRWKFLTGDPRSVARVAEEFGVLYYPERGQIVHSQAVAVIDPRGRLANIYYGEQWTPESVIDDLQKARKG
jgi:protein SCO1/2